MLRNLISLLFLLVVSNADFLTRIEVKNHYPEPLHFYIHGAGAGGCDIDVSSGERNKGDCHCVWGTLDYTFCAYRSQSSLDVVTEYDWMGGVGCPSMPGEVLLCSDLHNIGNCYDRSYECNVDITGNCRCKST